MLFATQVIRDDLDANAEQSIVSSEENLVPLTWATSAYVGNGAVGLRVASEQGGFFDLGALWLVVDRQGGKPRLMTVNRQALDEALDAARDGAERNRGECVPFD